MYLICSCMDPRSFFMFHVFEIDAMNERFDVSVSAIVVLVVQVLDFVLLRIQINANQHCTIGGRRKKRNVRKLTKIHQDTNITNEVSAYLAYTNTVQKPWNNNTRYVYNIPQINRAWALNVNASMWLRLCNMRNYGWSSSNRYIVKSCSAHRVQVEIF